MAPEAAAETTLTTSSIPASAIADLENDPQTVAAAPEMPTSLIEPLIGATPANGEQWGLDATGVTSSAYDGSGVRVAVLDTGIEATHPAFHGLSLVQQDFTQTGLGDRNGHGTHCAGTVCGHDLGSLRIGVARGITGLLSGKVLSDDGKGDVLGALSGLRWAADMGANIVSMSLGFDLPGLIARLVEQGWPTELAASAGLEAYRKNMRLFDAQLALLRAQRELGREPLVIAAAGNESRRQIAAHFRIASSLPAAADGVLSVGALRNERSGLSVANFSNTLPRISAPGVDIVSAWVSGGVKALNGTSMACPHVAGIAALWWQQQAATASAETVRAKVVGGATYSGFAAGYNHTDVGSGIVRAP